MNTDATSPCESDSDSRPSVWKIIVGLLIMIVLGIMCIVSVVLSVRELFGNLDSAPFSSTPENGTVIKTTDTVCSMYEHKTPCKNDMFCEWDWLSYSCGQKYTQSVSKNEGFQECPLHHYPIVEKQKCYEAAVFLKISSENPTVFTLHKEDHPNGCYMYQNELHLNTANTGNYKLSNLRRLCEKKPDFCFNNIADCEYGETGVDCGGPCREECPMNSVNCATTTTPTPCTRFVAYSDKGWDARWGMSFLKKPYYFLHEMQCVNDEYTYSEKEGKCVIDQDGKLSIQVRHFPTTNPGCGVNGIGTPISYFNENEQCSYLYYVHPMGRTDEDEQIGQTRLTDLPWDTFRSQLQCSPTREDWDYWERCCFVSHE